MGFPRPEKNVKPVVSHCGADMLSFNDIDFGNMELCEIWGEKGRDRAINWT